MADVNEQLYDFYGDVLGKMSLPPPQEYGKFNLFHMWDAQLNGFLNTYANMFVKMSPSEREKILACERRRRNFAGKTNEAFMLFLNALENYVNQNERWTHTGI